MGCPLRVGARGASEGKLFCSDGPHSGQSLAISLKRRRLASTKPTQTRETHLTAQVAPGNLHRALLVRRVKQVGEPKYDRLGVVDALVKDVVQLIDEVLRVELAVAEAPRGDLEPGDLALVAVRQVLHTAEESRVALERRDVPRCGAVSTAERRRRAARRRRRIARELPAEAGRAAAARHRGAQARHAPLARRRAGCSSTCVAAQAAPRLDKARRGRTPLVAASSVPRAARGAARLAVRVDKVGLDATGLLARLLVLERADAVNLEGVRLEVELRFEDDKLLREAVGVRAQEVVVLKVLLL